MSTLGFNDELVNEFNKSEFNIKIHNKIMLM